MNCLSALFVTLLLIANQTAVSQKKISRNVPTNHKLVNKAGTDVTLLIGSLTITNKLKPGQTNTLIDINDFKFSIKNLKSKMLVSTILYSESGELIAEVEDNKFFVNKYSYRKNEDDRALEIIDKYNHVVFCLEKLAPDTFRLKGIVRKNGATSVLNDSGLSNFPTKEENTPEGKAQLESIRRIFEYTGNHSFGKRAKR